MEKTDFLGLLVRPAKKEHLAKMESVIFLVNLDLRERLEPLAKMVFQVLMEPLARMAFLVPPVFQASPVNQVHPERTVFTVLQVPEAKMD